MDFKRTQHVTLLAPNGATMRKRHALEQLSVVFMLSTRVVERRNLNNVNELQFKFVWLLS